MLLMFFLHPPHPTHPTTNSPHPTTSSPSLSPFPSPFPSPSLPIHSARVGLDHLSGRVVSYVFFSRCRCTPLRGPKNPSCVTHLVCLFCSLFSLSLSLSVSPDRSKPHGTTTTFKGHPHPKPFVCCLFVCVCVCGMYVLLCF